MSIKWKQKLRAVNSIVEKYPIVGENKVIEDAHLEGIDESVTKRCLRELVSGGFLYQPRVGTYSSL